MWSLATVPRAADMALALKLGQPDWFTALLRLRGVTNSEEAETFLNPGWDDLPDPFTLHDMPQGVQRLLQARERQEQIAIYGDYDADGVTAVALLVRGFHALGFLPPLTYIPDRFDEGYGLNMEALEYLLDEGATLIVTVDCGIVSFTEALFLQEQGVDLIITDHHTPEATLPVATAVINPMLPSSYPTTSLAGVGVAYELIRSLSLTLERPQILPNLLALVAVGTIADIIELTGPNRFLVGEGLKQIERTPYLGLKALLAPGDVPNLSTNQVAFSIVPKLNASGRMQHADLALELLLSQDPDEAEDLARELDSLNNLRKETEAAVLQEALALYAELDEAKQHEPLQMLYQPHWHHGVLGIVATRLVEKWQCPVFIAAATEDGVRGSGRVPEGYNIYQLLSDASEHLTTFGGHRLAAGFSCTAEQLIPLKKMLLQGVRNITPPPLRYIAELELPPEGDWQDIYRRLRLLEPYGSGNQEVNWLVRGAEVKTQRLMGQGEHLSATLNYGSSHIDLVAWRMAASMGSFLGMVDLIAKLTKNSYRGQETIRLELVAWRPSVLDNLETIQTLRRLPSDATFYYALPTSQQALLEAGWAITQDFSPLSADLSFVSTDEFPVLPPTQRVTLGEGSGVAYLLDPLYNCSPLGALPPKLIASPLQIIYWQQTIQWLLPATAELRQYYRWLQNLGGTLLQEIELSSTPGGLSPYLASYALHNVLSVFQEAGFCRLTGDRREPRLELTPHPQQTQIDTLSSYQELRRCREELQQWILKLY
ncbi:MAG: single-stranded-DNA-specific exonuclease RecJ [Symbiobacteriaceae bacterium]|nr:single-stranded-DNA-specific exonuclease RecJ [Symbiobacteriaceae bacterium]